MALMAYYSGITQEEVSRFAPTLSIDTIFILILSFIFLGESFSLPVYLGIFSVVAGAYLISLDDPVHSLKKFESRKGVYLAILAAFIFSLRDISFKFFLINSSYWNLLLGMSVGGLISIAVLGIYRKDLILESSDKGLEHLLLLGVFMALGYVSFVAAIKSGPVSLASAVVKSQNLMIFAFAVILQKLHPGIVDETLEKSVLLQKVIAVVLIMTGLLIINFI